jgi:hypothetical protein
MAVAPFGCRPASSGDDEARATDFSVIVALAMAEREPPRAGCDSRFSFRYRVTATTLLSREGSQ